MATSGRGSQGPFVSRRQPGTRRSGAGLSIEQRSRRNRWGLIFLVTLLVLIVGRLAVVQGVDGAAYANAAQQDRLRTYPIAALRGEILDSSGRPLAYTVDASRVVADPTLVTDAPRTALALTTLLGVPVPTLTTKLSQHTRYVVLAGKISPEKVTAIQALGLPGVSFEDDPLRLYPAGAVGGQVVGFVNRQAQGLAGIEGRFDPIVISSEIGVAKPRPEPFEHAVGVARVDPSAAWFVGDNLWTDVLGASRAGLRTVWIDRLARALPPDAPQPDLVVPSLADLPRLLLR